MYSKSNPTKQWEQAWCNAQILLECLKYSVTFTCFIIGPPILHTLDHEHTQLNIFQQDFLSPYVQTKDFKKYRTIEVKKKKQRVLGQAHKPGNA